MRRAPLAVSPGLLHSALWSSPHWSSSVCRPESQAFQIGDTTFAASAVRHDVRKALCRVTGDRGSGAPLIRRLRHPRRSCQTAGLEELGSVPDLREIRDQPRRALWAGSLPTKPELFVAGHRQVTSRTGLAARRTSAHCFDTTPSLNFAFCLVLGAGAREPGRDERTTKRNDSGSLGNRWPPEAKG